MHYFVDTKSSELNPKYHIFDFQVCFDILGLYIIFDSTVSLPIAVGRADSHNYHSITYKAAFISSICPVLIVVGMKYIDFNPKLAIISDFCPISFSYISIFSIYSGKLCITINRTL
jgi:hypothetical protein